MSGLSFLLEIGTEDLPARFILPAIQQLKENTRKILDENHITFSEIRTYGTPRRLAAIVEGIPLMQEDRTKEVFGPSKKVAFDENGSPTKAAIGFAHGQGVSVEKLTIRNKDKGEYVVAILEEKGIFLAAARLAEQCEYQQKKDCNRSLHSTLLYGRLAVGLQRI